MLIYGEFGAGKTYFGGTAADSPDTAPVLVVDVEGGTMTLRGRNIDVVQVRRMKDLEHIHDTIAADIHRYYKTVIIDSLTELQKLDMRTVMKQQHDKKPDTTDIYVPSQREWGKSGERVRMIIRAFRDLPVNTIVTALLTELKDERTGAVSFHPSLPGKLRAEVPGFFDIVGLLSTYTEKEDNKEVVHRQIQFAKTAKVAAKDRTNALGDVMKNPTIPMLWEKINNISYTNGDGEADTPVSPKVTDDK